MYTDFSAFSNSLLNEQQWIYFQETERAFRKTLDTRNLQEKPRFFSSADPGKWLKLLSLLNGIFFRSGVFIGPSFGLPFLKYAARILKKLPLGLPFPEELTPASTATWIEAQLCFARDTIQPFLGAGQRQRRSKVSRNKLSYLWQHRKSKAIQIILNNSE